MNVKPDNKYRERPQPAPLMSGALKPLTIRELYTRTALALKNPNTWCKIHLSEFADGLPCYDELDNNAVKWCAEGHLRRTAQNDRNIIRQALTLYFIKYNNSISYDNDYSENGRELIIERLLSLAND